MPRLQSEPVCSSFSERRMNPRLFLIVSSLSASLLASCTTRPADQTAQTPSSTSTKPIASPVSPQSEGASAPVVSSFKETKRLDHELGKSVVPYPFDSCAVLQRPFGPEGPKHRRIYKGQEVLFCCTPCVHAFDANPEPFMPRILAAVEAKKADANLPIAPTSASSALPSPN